MKISSLHRPQPPTAEEFAARAEAERMRDQIRENAADLKPQFDARLGVGGLYGGWTDTARRRGTSGMASEHLRPLGSVRQ
jgi:hypothetical protein